LRCISRTAEMIRTETAAIVRRQTAILSNFASNAYLNIHSHRFHTTDEAKGRGGKKEACTTSHDRNNEAEAHEDATEECGRKTPAIE